MAVADACIEVAKLISEMCLQGLNQLVGLGGGDLVRGMIQHDLVLVFALVGKSDYVTTVCRFVGSHGKAHADGLQRGTTSRIYLGVKGKNGHICRVALGNHAVGNVGNQTHGGAGGQGVHAGLDCGLHGGTVAKGGDGAVGHSVRDQDKIFHG